MLSFRQFLAILRARVWETIGVWLAIVIAVAIVTLVLPKRYTATATVVVDIRAPELFNSTNTLNAAWVPSYVTTQLDVLKSELVTLKAIDALGLDRDLKQRDNWLKSTKGQGDFRSWIASQLQTKLEVKTSLQSNALYVAYTAASPEMAASVANAIVQGYIDTAVEMRAEPTRRFSSFFDERSKKLREQLESAQERLSAFQRANGILAKDEKLDTETARLNELNTQLVSIQAQVADSSSRRVQVSADPARSPEVMGNPVVAGLAGDLNRQQARLQELSTRLDDGHPQVIEAKAIIGELRRRIAETSSQVSSGVASTDMVNRSRLARLESSIAEQRQRVLSLNERRDQVAVLVREVENAQKAYDLVLTRATQTNLESQDTQTNVTILKHASLPGVASSPHLGLNIAVAFLVGLIAAIGVAVAHESLDRRLYTQEDVTVDLKVPFLGELADRSSPAVRRRFPPLLRGPSTA